MAPLPENNTNRLFVDYAGDFGIRSMLFRTADGLSAAESVERVSNFLENVIAPFWYNEVATTGYRWSAVNTAFSLPVTGPQVVGQIVGTQPDTEYPEFLAFQGRGTVFGRKVRLSVYGMSMNVTPNYRITEAESPFVAPLLAGLRGLIVQGAFRTIANEAPVIQDYLNAGFNAYHQRKLRRAA